MNDKLYLLPQVEPQSLAAQVKEWRSDHPSLGALVLLPENERGRIPELQAAFNDVGAPLLGAVFPQLINDSGEFQSSGLLLIKLDPVPAYILQGGLDCGSKDLDGTVESLAQSIFGKLEEEKETTLFMVFDAMVPRIATILESLYLRLADRVNYTGLNAGSESFKPIPCLFDNLRAIEQGVLVLLLPDSPRVAIEHGYRPPENLVAATSTEGNRIISIDWRPAFEVYREQLKMHYGEEVNRENFYRLAVHFPFGIVRADGAVVVRFPVILEEDGSLFCVGEVPANSVLTLLAAPQPDSLDTARTLAKQLDGEVLGELLLFYCAGRRMHLGEAAEQEVRAIRKLTGAKHVAGVLSVGEIGSTTKGGYPLFHNATVVCMADF